MKVAANPSTEGTQSFEARLPKPSLATKVEPVKLELMGVKIFIHPSEEAVNHTVSELMIERFVEGGVVAACSRLNSWF